MKQFFPAQKPFFSWYQHVMIAFHAKITSSHFENLDQFIDLTDVLAKHENFFWIKVDLYFEMADEAVQHWGYKEICN